MRSSFIIRNRNKVRLASPQKVAKKSKIFASILGAVLCVSMATAISSATFSDAANRANDSNVSHVSESVEIINHCKSSEQIEKDATMFGADMSYSSITLSGNQMVLSSNANDPIWVEISGDAQKYASACEEAFDYWSGFMSNINEQYKFQITDNDFAEQARNAGQTVIQVQTENKTSDALASATMSANSSGAIKSAKITLNDKMIDEHLNAGDNEFVVDSFIHEIMHILGINDVYNESNLKTMICLGSMENMLRLPSLSDMKCLFSKYYDKHLQNDGKDAQAIAEANAMFNKYEKAYDRAILLQTIKNLKIDESTLEPINNEDLQGLSFEGVSRTSNLRLSRQQDSEYVNVVQNYSFSDGDFNLQTIVSPRNNENKVVKQTLSQETNGKYGRYDKFISLDGYPYYNSIADDAKDINPKVHVLIIKTNGKCKLLLPDNGSVYYDEADIESSNEM